MVPHEPFSGAPSPSHDPGREILYPRRTAFPTRISVIIPTLNEETHLPETVERLCESSFVLPTEIIVVDGGSSDGTVEIARNLCQLLLHSPKPGRAVQMDMGARHASGDLLLFLHCDTILHRSWQRVLVRAWEQEPGLVATAFRLRFRSRDLRYRVLEGFASLRTRITGIAHGDQALAVPKGLYLHTGGFPPVPLMEEYELLKRLKRLGRIRILPVAAETSPRRYEKRGVFRTALRNNLLIAAYYLGVSPETLARYYR